MTGAKSGAKVVLVPKTKHISVVFAVTLSLIVLVPAAGASTRRTAASNLLRAVNRTRTAHGLRPLKLDVKLVRAARSHSDEMLRGNVFTHGDFHSRMVAFGVRGTQAGENLAWGSGPYAQAPTIVAEWLASPEHRANLLHQGWTRIGIGLARGTFLGNGGSTVVTADFAG
jgi:uncharacterized protein YkwD